MTERYVKALLECLLSKDEALQLREAIKTVNYHGLKVVFDPQIVEKELRQAPVLKKVDS